MTLDKPLDGVSEADLQSLVANQVPEGRQIEYKEVLPSNRDADKKEFLADVSSLANAAGGDLIYGVREEAGIAKEVIGVALPDADAEQLRIESIIRDGIDPRIPGIQLRPVQRQTGNPCLILRVPRSWAGPHAVTYQGSFRFYSRTSAGKYPLDVFELRAAFTSSEAVQEKVRKFRLERLAKIIADEGPIQLQGKSKIVLHLIPLNSFASTTSYDLDPLAKDAGSLQPIYAGGWDHRYNLDGLLSYCQSDRKLSAESYLQIFRLNADSCG